MLCQPVPVAIAGIGETETDLCGAGGSSCQDSDIRVEYHPSSGHRPETFKFEEFTQAAPACAPSVDPEPWAPFKTWADFEFAVLAQDTGMSKAQVNSLISLLHRCIESGKDSFTL